jgi:DHA2 family multidrug resistance protein-like MFS transporter
MTPWPVAAGVAAFIAGLLADKFSSAILSACGLTIFGFGLLAMGFLPRATTAFAIAGLMAVCGLGFGFFQSPNNRTMLSAAPLLRSGAAGGMLATARLTGQTIGATIAAITFRLAAHAELVALVVAALFAFAAALASLSRLRYESPAKMVERPPVPDAP